VSFRSYEENSLKRLFTQIVHAPQPRPGLPAFRKNKLRTLLRESKPTVGTHGHSTWPGMMEVIGATGLIDYVEFLSVIDDEVAVIAGEFKCKYAIPVADALIASSAYCSGLIVVSDDPDFKKILELDTLTEKEFAARVLA
jgi:hypothetical protein